MYEVSSALFGLERLQMEGSSEEEVARQYADQRWRVDMGDPTAIPDKWFVLVGKRDGKRYQKVIFEVTFSKEENIFVASVHTSAVYHRYFNDRGSDDLGRRSFAVCWEDTDGGFRNEPSRLDDGPVGYRRAQYYKMNPDNFEKNALLRGHVVEDMEGEDPYEVAFRNRSRRH